MIDATANPLLRPWTAPHGMPPFGEIRPKHFPPAFEVAMREHRAELDAIADEPAAPSFDNTVARFDASGRRFTLIEHVFHNLCASHTSPALQAVQRELSAPLAAHANAITLHERLFERIDAVHARRAALGLPPQALRLVERLHLDFVRSGALLRGADRARYAAITERLAALSTRFGQNVLADENDFRLVLAHEADMAGLPEFVRDAARQAAAERGLSGAVITLSRSLVVPFLSFSDRRDLREAAWRAWTTRGEHEGPHDNRPVLREMLELRAEMAALLGHENYADHALADSMAGSRAAVLGLLDVVWARALPALERERVALLQAMREAGATHELEAWDWRWWAEKVRRQRFAIDEAELKAYFPLDRMVAAAFDCAERLFGIRMVERADLPVYHSDVKAYEVRAADGTLRGVFLHDNFARPSKRSGAWMSHLREQSRHAGTVLPIVVNNNNFAKACDGQPTLLSFDDVRTLFHEFGHGLHGLLSDVEYERLSGTNVRRDFVELPSQLFEHWISEPQVLRRHALHVRTGEPMPEALIERLARSRRTGQAYETVRYVASALTDLAVHALPRAQVPADQIAFEADVLRRRGLPPAVGVNHRVPHFQHLFRGSGYAAGYYVYLWAEVLDADAYGAFEEAGDPFDPVLAQRLLRHVYAAGDSVDPARTYEAFRGRAAGIEPMLGKRGLLEAA